MPYNYIMHKFHVDYNFDALMEHLSGFLPTTTLEDVSRFRDALFETDDFAAYAAEFFAGDFLPKAYQYMDQYKLPRKNQLLKLFGAERWHGLDRFFMNGFTRADGNNKEHDGVRDTFRYPLTREEFSKGMDFTRDNPDYFLGLAAIQACVSSYLEDVLVRIMHDPRTQDFRDYVAGDDTSVHFKTLNFINNARDKNFLRDLSVMIGSTVANHEDSFSEEALRDSLMQKFRKQAFRSQREGVSVIKCPFSSHYARFMSVRIDRDGGGVYAVQTGNFGSFLTSVMDLILSDVPQSELAAIQERFSL